MAIARTVEGLAAMKAEVLQKDVDFVVVKTDGWVEGDIEVRYKTALVNEIKPDWIICIKAGDELNELIAQLKQPVLMLRHPPHSASEPRKNVKA